MKNIILILSALLFTTACTKDKSKSPLYGTWELTSFVNSETNNVIVEGDFSDSNTITISIDNEMSFKGNTVRNEFSGTYTLKENNQLVFTKIYTTKVNETKWADLFYKSIKPNQQNTYKIEKNTMKIYYSDNEYMTFKKL